MSGVKGNNAPAASAYVFRHNNVVSLQHDLSLVQRQTVKARTMFRCKGFELVEGAFFFESFGVALERKGRIEYTGAAASGFFGARFMRRRIRTEEKFRRARCRNAAQGKTMLFALRYRQTIMMRTNAPFKHGVAIDFQMMRRNRRCNIGGACLNKRGGVRSCDMLEHNFQLRKISHNINKDALDKHGFAIKDINVGVRHLAMHQQRHADALHGAQHRIDIFNVRYAKSGVRRCIRRVKLAGGKDALCKAAFNFGRLERIREIAGHQRRKVKVRRYRLDNAIAVGFRRRNRRHRLCQIGHDDRPRKLAGRVVGDSFEHFPVAQMHMPVIGPAELKTVLGHAFTIAADQALRDGVRKSFALMRRYYPAANPSANGIANYPKRLKCGPMTESIVALNDRAILRLSGDDRQGFLQGLITQDVDLLEEGGATFTSLLTPQGKILFDFFVINQGDHYLIDCNVDAAPALVKRLSLYKLRAKVKIEEADDVQVSWSLTEPSADGIAFADPRLAALGWRMIAPKGATSDGQASSLAAYHDCRITLGVPEFGSDFEGDDIFLLDVNYDALNGVSYKKGCFIGQEVTSRMKRKGQARKRTLIVEHEGGPLPAGADITAGASTLGNVSSSTAGKSLARTRLDRWEKAAAAKESVICDGRELRLSVPEYLE